MTTKTDNESDTRTSIGKKLFIYKKLVNEKNEGQCRKKIDRTFEQNYPQKVEMLFPINHSANKFYYCSCSDTYAPSTWQKLTEQQKKQRTKKTKIKNIVSPVSVKSVLTDLQCHLLGQNLTKKTIAESLKGA